MFFTATSSELEQQYSSTSTTTKQDATISYVSAQYNEPNVSGSLTTSTQQQTVTSQNIPAETTVTQSSTASMMTTVQQSSTTQFQTSPVTSTSVGTSTVDEGDASEDTVDEIIGAPGLTKQECQGIQKALDWLKEKRSIDYGWGNDTHMVILAKEVRISHTICCNIS